MAGETVCANVAHCVWLSFFSWGGLGGLGGGVVWILGVGDVCFGWLDGLGLGYNQKL